MVAPFWISVIPALTVVRWAAAAAAAVGAEAGAAATAAAAVTVAVHGAAAAGAVAVGVGATRKVRLRGAANDWSASVMKQCERVAGRKQNWARHCLRCGSTLGGKPARLQFADRIWNAGRLRL